MFYDYVNGRCINVYPHNTCTQKKAITTMYKTWLRIGVSGEG